MAKILIIGCGKIGQPLAEKLATQGHQVTGLRRTPMDATNTEAPKWPFKWLSLDITNQAKVAALPTDYDQVIIILTPAARSPEGYAQIYQHGLSLILKRLNQTDKTPDCIFVSATSVYGEQHGAWLNETSETAPTTYNGKSLFDAERAILAFGENPIVVRFSGIYGAARTRVLDKLNTPQEIQRTPPQYTNRIHQDDCIAVLNHLATLQRAKQNQYPLYLATDHDPAPMFEMMTWLAKQTDRTPPTPIDIPQASNPKQNKRCSNQRLIDSGYQFIYQNYQQGYAALINAKQTQQPT